MITFISSFNGQCAAVLKKISRRIETDGTRKMETECINRGLLNSRSHTVKHICFLLMDLSFFDVTIVSEIIDDSSVSEINQFHMWISFYYFWRILPKRSKELIPILLEGDESRLNFELCFSYFFFFFRVEAFAFDPGTGTESCSMQ